MKVQRIRFFDTNRSSWIVLGDDYLPVKPIVVFLKFMEDLGRSPNTIRATSFHLKLFWEYLRDECLDWKDVDIAHLAAFISWLRNPQPGVKTLKVYKAERTHGRDKFLLALLYETGIRIGQALGLRHSDISIENGKINIIPREDNANGMRAKTRDSYTIPAKTNLMQLYTDYL